MTTETAESAPARVRGADAPTPHLDAALMELHRRLPTIVKDKIANVQTEKRSYRYKYADLSRISGELLPILAELGLVFKAKPTLNAANQLVLAYKLTHVSSGESDPGEFPLQLDRSPQAVGSWITYARRYCLVTITGLALADDDDDALQAERAARRDTKKPTAAPGSITPEQLLRMQQLFRDVGLYERDEKLKYANEVVKRPLASATELTGVEADRVIAKLERWAAQSQPPAGGETP